MAEGVLGIGVGQGKDGIPESWEWQTREMYDCNVKSVWDDTFIKNCLHSLTD